MNKRGTENLAASVRQRLLNVSRQRQEDYNLLLSRHAIERLLYRLTQSPFAEQFILKGATLFAVWTGKLHRPTYDLDLLGYGDNSSTTLTTIFGNICQVVVEADGLTFDPNSVRVQEILEGQIYGGQHVDMIAKLDIARIPVRIDIGFGDAVTPSPVLTEYPTLLTLPSPRLRTYPPETVIAEKLHAMVVLGMTNSRMKDFYDLWILARLFAFEGATLAKAMQATFVRRQTAIPAVSPLALTVEFATNLDKIKQWQAFLNRSQLDGVGVTFGEVIATLHGFLWPPLAALTTAPVFSAIWPAGGPWR
jgi:predicted nucleotidyltransferase component of viral defense system